jgi:hypothetical protein
LAAGFRGAVFRTAFFALAPRFAATRATRGWARFATGGGGAAFAFVGLSV